MYSIKYYTPIEKVKKDEFLPKYENNNLILNQTVTSR